MTPSFIELKELLPDESVHTFLNTLQTVGDDQEDPFFLFSQNLITRRFKQSAEQLAGPMTVEEDDFPEDTHVLAMTIDGDFILASDHYVYVVGKNLIADDIEVYDLSPIDFFVAFEHNQLASHILPND